MKNQFICHRIIILTLTFFSFICNSQTILGSNTTFWIQAENGPTNAGFPTSSGTVNAWSNLVNNPSIPSLNQLTGSATPSDRSVIDGDAAFNYNSVMNLNAAGFSRINLLNNTLCANNQGSMYVVASSEDLSFNLMSLGAFAPGHRYNTGFRNGVTTFGSSSCANVALNVGRANIMGLTASSIVGSVFQKNRINGIETSNNSATNITPVLNADFVTFNNYCLAVGNFPGFHYTGKVAEAIFISTSITNTQLNQIDSYLAIKYGVTLSHDYLSSNSAITVYAIDPIYRNNIIGIARDLAYGGLVSGGGSAIASNTLFQKQSHNFDDSVRIYKGSLHPTTNRLNTATFSQDVSYVVMGANLGRLKGISTEMPIGLLNCDLFSRLEREWKVTKTNFGGTEMFNWDVKLSSIAAPGSVNVADLRLLVDDDGDFSNGGTQCYFNGDGTGLVITYNNPTITVSNISDIHIPNNSTKYITIASINNTTPLPINLLSYTAQYNSKGTVDLNWSTSSEVNIDYYTIEKSSDLTNWNFLDNVNGSGTSYVTNNYFLEDFFPYNGVTYYKLMQTDFDGNKIEKGIRAVQRSSIISNKSNDNILIKVIDTNSKFLLFDNLGKNLTLECEIIEIDTNYYIQLNLNKYAKGIYYLHLINDNETIKLVNF